jgi:hypothetical protein
MKEIKHLYGLCTLVGARGLLCRFLYGEGYDGKRNTDKVGENVKKREGTRLLCSARWEMRVKSTRVFSTPRGACRDCIVFPLPPFPQRFVLVFCLCLYGRPVALGVV